MATNQQSNNSSYMAMNGNVAVKRIRTPTNTDVLLGRGGGINNHIGNRVFRDWVRERKDDYNLAPSKTEKTRVAKEVMERVHSQSPPGRFLQKDPSAGSSGGWWVEVDELRALSKTSQALREGAPQIRAANLGTPPTTRKRKSSSSTSPSKSSSSQSQEQSRSKTSVPASDSITGSHPAARTRTRRTPSIASGKEEALNELSRNLLEAKTHSRPQQQPQQQPSSLPSFARPLMSNQEFKRTRVDLDATPPLLSVPHHQEEGEEDAVPPLSLDTITPPPLPMVPPKSEDFSRAHSLALSDISGWGTTTTSNDPFDWQDDFVNPFLDESDIVLGQSTPTSTPVGGGGVGAFYHPAAADSPARTMVRNVSSDEDRENYGQLGEMNGHSPNHDYDATYDNHIDYFHDDDDAYDGYNPNHHSYSSIRDFNEEMKLMMDEVHPEEDLTYPSKELRTGTEASSPSTLLLPWRGGTLQRRYGSNGTVKSNSNHSNSHRSLSIGELLNERQ